MVAIHGRWCGPNWTDGRAISARDYKLQGGDFKGSCVDSLDCACREHDRRATEIINKMGPQKMENLTKSSEQIEKWAKENDVEVGKGDANDN